MDQQAPAQLQSPSIKTDGQDATLPNIPETWPGAWGAYKYSKQAMKRNWVDILCLALASFAVSLVLTMVFGKSLFSQVIEDIINIFFGVAVVIAVFASVDGKKIAFKDALKAVTPQLFINYLLVSLLLIVLLGVSLIAFILPFVFIFPRIAFAPYIVVDKKVGPIEAIKESWALSSGHSSQVWGVTGASVAMVLLMLTIIGIPFALYFLFMYTAADIILYKFIESHTQQKATPTTTKQSS